MVALLGPSSGAGQLLNELIQARDELAKAEQRYSTEHPDVRKLSSKVASLEVELSLAAAAIPAPTQQTSAVRPSNPVYINLKTQLDNVTAQKGAAELRRSSLLAKISTYEARVLTSPTIEQEYRSLITDLEVRKATYNDLSEKLTLAELASKLEDGGKSERFEIVDPAVLPATPDRPNRLGIVLISFLLAASAGIGMAAIGEYTDNTIYGSKGLVAAFGAQPIAVIPNIPERDLSGVTAVSSRIAQGLAYVIVIVLVVAAVLFVYELNGTEQGIADATEQSK